MKFSYGLLLLILSVNLTGSSPSQKLYFSKVPKNSVTNFLHRLATSEFHYVITRTPVSKALIAKQFSVGPNVSAVITEYVRNQSEGNCIDQFCFATLNITQADHLDFLVGNEEIVAPEITVQPNWQYRNELGFVGDIDSELLKEHNAVLSGEKAIDSQGTTIKERKKETSKKLARNFLRAEYEKLGYIVTEDKFVYGDYSGANLVAEKKGLDSGFIIVSAHLDTVSSPGADDDASGLVTSLAIARSLANTELKYGVRFVAFDFEEVGLVGSKSYAQQLKESNQINQLLGVFNVEMTGYNPKGNSAIHIIDCDENTSPQLTKLVQSAIQSQGLSLKRVDACTNRSDHASFWMYNRPAVVVSENFFGGEGNPCYHRSCDLAEKLDFKYMSQIAQALLGAIASMVAR